MRLLAFTPAIVVLAAPAAAQAPDARTAIMAAMADSAEGWNRGDIDRFLALYSDDPATAFVTAAGIERGKASIRAKYLRTYLGQFGADASKRSTLSFATQDLRPIGADHALLVARWTLTTPGTDKPQTGLTSLLFRREAAGWRIISDHSS